MHCHKNHPYAHPCLPTACKGARESRQRRAPELCSTSGRPCTCHYQLSPPSLLPRLLIPCEVYHVGLFAGGGCLRRRGLLLLLLWLPLWERLRSEASARGALGSRQLCKRAWPGPVGLAGLLLRRRLLRRGRAGRRLAGGSGGRSWCGSTRLLLRLLRRGPTTRAGPLPLGIS